MISSHFMQVGSFMTISVSVTFPALCHQILYKGQNSTGKVGAGTGAPPAAGGCSAGCLKAGYGQGMG
jgi:hypothetical protein